MSLMLSTTCLTAFMALVRAHYGWLLRFRLGTTRPFIWAFLLLRDLGSRENAFRTSHFLGMLQYRLTDRSLPPQRGAET